MARSDTAWSFTMDPNRDFTVGGRPVVAVPERGLLLAADGKALYALRIADGALAWKATAYSTIAHFSVQGGSVFVTDGKLLRALNLADGTSLWEYEARGMTQNYDSPPVATDRLVFAGEFQSGAIHAVRRSNGNELWVRRYSNALTSDLVANDRMVFYSAEASVKALDQLTGNLLWTWVPTDGSPSDPIFRVARNFIALLQPNPFFPAGSVLVTYQNNYSINAATGNDDRRLSMGVYTEPMPPNCVACDAPRERVAFGNALGHVFALVIPDPSDAWLGAWPGRTGPPLSGNYGTQLAFAGDTTLVAALLDGATTDVWTMDLSHIDAGAFDMPGRRLFTRNEWLLAPFAVVGSTMFALTLPPDADQPGPDGRPRAPAAEVHAIPLPL